MYLKSIALFVAIYGYGTLAALPPSCEEGDNGACATGDKCTPLTTETEPPQTGEVWYSTCCTESETDNSVDPPVTTTKKYCYSWKLKDVSSNLHYGIKPTCSKSASSSVAWDLYGQCSTSGTTDPYSPLPALNPPGCPGQWDSSTNYESGDTVEYNGAVYTCQGDAAFCNLNAPDLRSEALNYWRPTNSCTGTISPTGSPTFASTQAGCPEEFDDSTVYEPGDSISVSLQDGRSVVYRCKPFPSSNFCSDSTYEPANTQKQCNGGVCWPQAWIRVGGCDGTYTPTSMPTFDPANVGGCPAEFVDGTEYKEGDKVSVTPAGETYGKIYECKTWPNSGHCKQAGYSPADINSNWKDAWNYVGGCYGTITPTSAPTFASVEGCPEAFDDGAQYSEGDKVSVTPAGETYGKIYKCKKWPSGDHCDQAGYSPADINSNWKDAWTYVGGCYGTISPTATPTFDPANVEGCPEAFDDDAEYEEGDKVSVTPAGETFGKVYKCKGWPARCGQDGFSPEDTDSSWAQAWTYEGGCTGTIAPTGSPTFGKIPEWNLGGCPDEYVPNYQYKPEDVVSVSKNADNTYGVVWQCKNAKTYKWCQLEAYAPGTQHASEAWEMVGHCSGTIAPTDAPTQFTGACQFKYKLDDTKADSPYVILQAEDWVKDGTTVSTGGDKKLELYKPGNLVRYGNDARRCAPYPNSGWCNQVSPFVKDVSYNPTHSPQGWKDATCEAIAVKDSFASPADVVFDAVTGLGSLFASNGNLLVTAAGLCMTGDFPATPSFAINPEDYFKASPAVAGCQQCDTGTGFGSPVDPSWPNRPRVCITCLAGTTSKIVDGKSQCVCDNGATDPWTAGAPCQSCPGGKKYIGDTSDSSGVCASACPPEFPLYTQPPGTTFKVCCKETDQDGTECSERISRCWDSTPGKSICSSIPGFVP